MACIAGIANRTDHLALENVLPFSNQLPVEMSIIGRPRMTCRFQPKRIAADRCVVLIDNNTVTDCDDRCSFPGINVDALVQPSATITTITPKTFDIAALPCNREIQGPA